MAERKQSKLRYDDFVASVQADPGKPVATTMLSGFVGQGSEGHARIYPDPSLGTWYDVPEDAVIHSEPIADSKLGGSHVWVKADAQIKPGAAAAAAQPAVAITPQPTPATHCFICPPHVTLATICTLTPVCPPHLTLATICTLPPVCPPHTPPLTPATICTCPQPSAAPTLCLVPQTLPCTLLCQADARLAAAPAALPPTLGAHFDCYPQTFGPTAWCTFVGCPPHG
jgi:hypothetical protein